MRRFAALLMLAVCIGSAGAQSVLEALDRELTALARKVQNAVVSVEGGVLVSPGSPPAAFLTKPDSEPIRRLLEGLRLLNLPNPVTRKGSGFVVDKEGWIITSADVVRGAETCTVRLADGRKVRGKVISIDDATNLAMVKVEAPGLLALPMGDSDKLEPGNLVLGVGTQAGYEQSVSLYMIAGRERIGVIGQQQFLSNLLQIAGPVSAGSSGAALINMQGEVVGVIVASLSPGIPLRQPEATGSAPRGSVPALSTPTEMLLLGSSGGGLAVPVNDIRPVLADMKAGKVRRAFLGIVPSDIDGGVGAEVVRIIPDSPAARAGVRLGDVIIMMNGQPVRRAADLSARLRQMKPGDTLQMVIHRGLGRITVRLQLGERKNTP